MSPGSPDKYREYFQLSPITPVQASGHAFAEVEMTDATMHTAQLAGNQTAMMSVPGRLATTEVEMSSDGIIPGDRVQSLTGAESIDLDQLLFEFQQAITASSPQEQRPVFISNMPQPVFDTEVFQKPLSPINASFADMDVDPRLTLINQDFRTEYPAIMPVQQQAYYYPQSTQCQPQPRFYEAAVSLGTSFAAESAIPVKQSATRTTAPQLRRVLQSKTSKKPAAASCKITYHVEAPQKSGAFRSVRINASTIGLSTRTGKINNWDPITDGGYITPPQPRPWTDAATGLNFAYNKWGELKSTTLTAEQLTAYLLSASHQRRQTLYIQRTPADSARRYPTTASSTCRLASCPGHLHSGRKIAVGTYRVAIDERWGSVPNSDPMVVAGYVHLYCLERFLDLPGLVASGVRFQLDERVIPTEPRGRFTPSFAAEVSVGRAEATVAKRFINALNAPNQSSALHALFPNRGYPVHTSYPLGGRKPHSRTLVAAMTTVRNASIPQSKIKMFTERGLKRSHLLVNLGDLEVSEVAKANEITRKSKNGKGKLMWEGDVVEIRHGYEVVVEEGRAPEEVSVDTGSDKGRKQARSEEEDEDEDTEGEDEEVYVPAVQAKRARMS